MIKKYIRNYIIRNLITSSLFILGNTLQPSSSISSKDTLDNYKNYNSEKINNLKVTSKKNFNALDEIIKCDSSFYLEKTKSQIYQIKPNLSFKYPIEKFNQKSF